MRGVVAHASALIRNHGSRGRRRGIARLRRCGLVTAVVVLTCVAGWAQQSHVNQARGFNANQVYSVHDLDSINVFNGNLVLGLPLGGTYKAGGNLSYSLKLFYNSNLWSYSEVGGDGSASVGYSYMTVWVRPVETDGSTYRNSPYPGAQWVYERFIPNDSQDPPRSKSGDSYTYAFPNGNANGGLGWQLTLGQLFEPRWAVGSFDPQITDGEFWVYQAPDGSEHQFYPTLHEDDPPGTDDDSPSTDPVTYTRDGSYLRMKVVNATTRTIEFPNGDVHTLQNLAPPPQGSIRFSPSWRVTRMRDQFGNEVNVTYVITRDGNQEVMAEQWQISDGFRTNYVNLERFPGTPEYGPVIRSVDLAGFNGARATYEFQYDVRTIRRAWPNVEDSPYIDVNVTVPFLKYVKQPDLSQYSMEPVDEAYDVTGVYSNTRYRGVLRKLTLPTGGRVEWDYKPETPDPAGAQYGYAYPTMSTGRNYLRRNYGGVRVRRLIEGGNTYTWRYDPQLEMQAAGCSFASTLETCAHKRFQSKVTTPQGDYTVHHFSVYPFPSDSDAGRQPADWHVAEYGLPLRKDISATLDDGTPVFLSTEVFRKNADATYTKLRETYVRYETDKLAQRDPWGAVVANDRRLAASRIVYLDDNRDGGVKYADLRHSDFDGLGHFRVSETGGNFGAGDYRLEQTVYNDDSGTYNIDPAANQPAANHTYQHYPEGRVWVLGNYTEKIQQEGQSVARQQFHFNQQGQLLRKRLLWQTGAGAWPSPHARDLLSVYAYDHAGNLASEDYYGGDKRADVPTGALASLTPPDPSEHRVSHTYEHGVLKTSAYRGSGLFSHNVDIDLSTGLVKRSRDLSKLWTDYTYDLMGRLTEVRPASGSRTVITYSPVTGGALGGTPRASVQHKTNNGAILLDEERFEYDNLGRLKVEKQKMPGGTFVARRTLYNGMGWMTAMSEWQADGEGFPNQTLYEEYDPFGRVQKVTPPDGSAHVLRYEYRGVRQIKRTTRAATALSNGVSTEAEVISFEGYDRQGRLGSVSEDSGSPGDALVQTANTYDVGGRINQVSTTGKTPPLRTNWAAAANGGRAVAESSHPSGNYPPSSANDGDRTGVNWGAGGGWNDGSPDQFPDQLWVDFNGQKQINEVNVFTLADDYRSGEQPTLSTTFTKYGIVRFDVHYLNTAGQLVLIASVSNNDKVWRQFRFAPVTTSKVLVTVYAARSLTTNYSRITEVEALEPAAAARLDVTQVRRFTYDNRGFLRSEQLPEVGASGNGLINYNEYDSLGRVGSRRDGANKLRYSYDAAGRLTLLRECLTEFAQCDTPGNSRPVKEYSYYQTDQSGSGIYELGRLSQARRHNYLLNPYTNSPADVVITESYQYRGPGALVSQRQLQTSTQLGFTQTFAYNDLGDLTSQTYPQCSAGNCTGAAAGRTVSYTVANGELTGVTGFARNIQYHPNRMISRIEHLNSGGQNLVTDLYEKDPHNIQRQRQITAQGPSVSWTTGLYKYDGAGNIKGIGPDWFVYDGAGRLAEGTALNSANPAERRKQRYTYDPFGNILQREDFYYAGTPSESRTVARVETLSESNRLNHVPHDASGNVTGGPTTPGIYQYDALNKMTVAPEKVYLYTADDERVWTVDHSGTTADSIVNTFTLRGLGNEVLREYTLVGLDTGPTKWSWAKDYVYAGSRLLTTLAPWGRLAFHPDHLGSPRLVTNDAGQAQALHNYLPFGEEATNPGQDAERLKFTGHERDFNTSGGHTLDYMHARFYAAPQAKFLSVDPGRDVDPKQPQRWNLYAYVRNNPVNARDPDGRALETISDVVGIGFSAYELWKDPSWTNAGLLAVDVGLAAVPFVPNTGSVRLAGRIMTSLHRGKHFANFIHKADRVYGFVNRLKAEKGVFHVLIHGGMDGKFYIKTANGAVPVSVEKVAALAKQAGYNGTDKVRLISCGAGRHDNGAAQQLANTLGEGVEVVAPIPRRVSINEAGSVINADNGLTLQPQEWRTFVGRE